MEVDAVEKEGDLMFYGYCRIPAEAGGGWWPPVTLNSPEEAIRYANLQKGLFPEVRITDADDFIVIQAKDGKIVYPEELAGKEK